MARTYVLRDVPDYYHDSRGSECERTVDVHYQASPGCAPTWDDPGSPAEVEIVDVVVSDGPPHVDPGCFSEACLIDWHEQRVAERDDHMERLADARRNGED